MRIVTLVENESDDRKLLAVHGLSFYIETKTRKILFDIGPNNYYIKNAKSLGIDLEDIDILVISHGHYDHGSGISKFLKINKKAKVYLSKNAFNEHVRFIENKKEFIGIKKPYNKDRIEYIDSNLCIDDELCIYSEVNYEKQKITDKNLKEYHDGRYVDERFNHEIYMVIHEGLNTVLFSGCSHKGIENIISTIENQSKIKFTHVLGGYHFSHYDSFDVRETEYLSNLGERLNSRFTTKFYSCHCTGNDAFFELKRKLKDKLLRLKTGSEVNI